MPAVTAPSNIVLPRITALDSSRSVVRPVRSVTTSPRGFEGAKHSPVAAYDCWKSFTAHAALRDADMQSPALVDSIVHFARSALPLLEWGWAVADDETPAAVPIRTPAPIASEPAARS